MFQFSVMDLSLRSDNDSIGGEQISDGVDVPPRTIDTSVDEDAALWDSWSPSTRCAIFKVNDSIFLGSQSSAQQFELLASHGINHLLCCARECPEPSHQNVGFTRLPLLDRPPGRQVQSDFENPFVEASCVLERLVRSGKKVLVYCQRGISRSPSVVIAYCIVEEGKSFSESLELVRRVCPRVDPNAFFCSLLLSLHPRYPK